MKQTAVEWLVEQLTEVERKNWINNKILSIGKNTLAKVTFDEIVEQAKEMEKQQMLQFYEDGYNRVAKLIEDATQRNLNL